MSDQYDDEYRDDNDEIVVSSDYEVDDESIDENGCNQENDNDCNDNSYDVDTDVSIIDDDEVDNPEYIDECPVNETHFNFIRRLGTGAFGTVFLAQKNCGIDAYKLYAIKVISKEEVVKVPKTITHMKAERKVLEIVRGFPFLATLYYAFQTDEKLFLVIDYVPGGEMFAVLQRIQLSEHHVRFYIAELILALEHIHKHGIVYRDIKLENILIDANGHIKLVDFGLCKKLGPRTRTKSFCGTVEYMAPEVIACSGHDIAADWWAIGVLTIELLTTSTPFGVNDTGDGNDIMNRITNEAPTIPEHASAEMKDFITRMLDKDQSKRLGGNHSLATEIKQHPLFNDVNWDKLEKKQLPSPEIPEINDPLDTNNFSKEFTQQSSSYEPSGVPPNSFNLFKGYSYIAPELDITNLDPDMVRAKMEENWNSWLSWEIYCFKDPDSEFHKEYKFASTEPIGKGKTSICFECIDSSEKNYAVKVYKRMCHNSNQIDVLRKATANRLPRIPRLKEVLHDSKWTYLIMELVKGSNLLEILSEIHITNTTIQNTFDVLLSTVKDVHSLNYVHKRICLKNILCKTNGSEIEFWLIGFSNATPKIHLTEQGIDYWSIAACLYSVLCGHSPFDMTTTDVQTVTKKIEDGDFNQQSDQWESLNKDTKRFIDQALCNSTWNESHNVFRFLNGVSPSHANYSQEQVDENENIVAIRAQKVQNYSVTDYSAFNGTVMINGSSSTAEHPDVIVADLDTREENHFDAREPQSNHLVNGHVEKVVKRGKNNIKTVREPKKQKTGNSEPLTILLQNLKIKKEKEPKPTILEPAKRSLRSKPGVSNTQTSSNTKARSETVQIKKEKFSVPEKSSEDAPKNQIVLPKALGRPRKNIAQPKTEASESQENIITEQIRMPSKRIAIKKEKEEKIHSRKSLENKQKNNRKSPKKFVSPILRKITESRYTNQYVQTTSTPLRASKPWTYQWPLRKPKTKKADEVSYCFERHDYN